MSDEGVPLAEVTAPDFILVRAALIKRVRGANEAVVWSRIHYRTAAESPAAYDRDGRRWWPASAEDISRETGLSAPQVRRAIESLVPNFLIREQHALDSNYDRTYSYSPKIDEGQIHVTKSSNGDHEIVRRDVTKSSDVLTLQTYLPTGEEVPPTPTALIAVDDVEKLPSDDELFDAFWFSYPRKEAKKPARTAFARALGRRRGPARAAFAAELAAAAGTHAHQWRDLEGRPIDRMPHAATWLRAERWLDELPTPEQLNEGPRPVGNPSIDHAASVHDELLRRAADRGQTRPKEIDE